MAKVNTAAAAHGVQLMPDSVTRTSAITHGAAAVTARINVARVSERRCQAA